MGQSKGGRQTPTPHKRFGGGRFGQGQPPVQKIQFFWTRLKIVARLPNFDDRLST